MAGKLTIRELLIKIGVATDKTKLDAFDKSLVKVKDSVRTVLLAGVAAAAGLYKLAESAARAGNEASKGSQRVGVSAQAYQELAYAAEKSGFTVEKMEMALSRLSMGAIRTSKGSKEQAAIFKDLGIKVLDSGRKVKRADVLLMEVADRFKRMADGPAKTAAAMRLFGEESGRGMIPMLNKGSAGLAAMREEARKLGIVLDEKGIKSAKDFMGSLKEVKTTIEALKMSIGMALLPVIAPMLTQLRDWIIQNRELIAVKVKDWASTLADNIDRLSSAIEVLFGVYLTTKALGTLSSFVAAIKAINSAITALTATGVTVLGVSIGWLIAIIAAAVAQFVAYYLVLEDIYYWLKGGNSLIGEWIEKHKKSQGIFGSVARIYDALAKVLRQIGSIVSTAVSPAIELLSEWLGKAADKAAVLLDKLGAFAESKIVGKLEVIAGALGATAGAMETGDYRGLARRAGAGIYGAGRGSVIGTTMAGAGTVLDAQARRAAKGAGSAVQTGDIIIQGVGISANEAETLSRNLFAEQLRHAKAAFAGGEL